MIYLVFNPISYVLIVFCSRHFKEEKKKTLKEWVFTTGDISGSHPICKLPGRGGISLAFLICVMS